MPTSSAGDTTGDQRALEAHPSPRIISDNGLQFIAGDFRRFIDLAGLTHVRTSVNYP